MPEIFDLLTGLPMGEPEKPIAPWLGGKRNLSKRICGLIDTTSHETYAEPFLGMGGVFLRRRSRPPLEAVNDISGDVVTLFRVMQRHPDALKAALRWRMASRDEFQRLLKEDAEALTDIERAARTLYLQRLAFGGKVTGQAFGVSAGRPRWRPEGLLRRLDRLHDRLAGVVIERLHYANFIERYDADGTLFYLDPPYWNGESDYGKGVFARPDFERISDALKTIKGRFLLSLNDVPEIREIFGWARLVPVKHVFSISEGAPTEAAELLITSLDAPGTV